MKDWVDEQAGAGDLMLSLGPQIPQICKSFVISLKKTLCLRAAVGKSRKTALRRLLESAFRSHRCSRGTVTMVICAEQMPDQ